MLLTHRQIIREFLLAVRDKLFLSNNILVIVFAKYSNVVQSSSHYADPHAVPVFESNAQYADAAGLFVNDINELQANPE